VPECAVLEDSMKKKLLFLLLPLCFLLMLASCGLFSDLNEGKTESEAILTHWNEEKNALIITLSTDEYFIFNYEAREDSYNYVGEWYFPFCRCCDDICCNYFIDYIRRHILAVQEPIRF
jgi:hypothetical protein